MNGLSANHRNVFRGILGGYLAIHFASLVPFGPELFSRAGALAAESSPLLGVIPNVLAVWDSPGFVVGFLVVAVCVALAFAAGVWERVLAVVLWFFWASLLGRNPLILNPGIPFVGWLLWVYAAMPGPGADGRSPARFTHLVWVVMMVGYSFSGLTKLGSPSWMDGTALAHVLGSPLAYSTALRDFILSQVWMVKWMTFGVLVLEILAAPLALFERARPWVWLALVGMHVGILATIDFADLTLGMLMIHVWTFDPRWVKLGSDEKDKNTRSFAVVDGV